MGDLEYAAPLGKSDHVCLKWSYKCSTSTLHTTSTARRAFWKGDYVAMTTMLSSIDWEKEFVHRNVDEAWIEIKQRCMEVMVKHIPLIQPRKKRKEFYMSKEPINLINKST